MKKNPFFQAIHQIVRTAGRNLHILRYGLHEDNWLRVTNTTHELRVCVSSGAHEPQLVDLNLLYQTGDLSASADAARKMDPAEFPESIAIGGPSQGISPQVLYNLVDLVPAVSKDESRQSLQYILVNHKRSEAVATDGHLLLLKKLDSTPRKSFLIDPLTLKIVNGFWGNIHGFALRTQQEVKDQNGKVVTPEACQLVFHGDGWELNVKVPAANEYPMYWKILPDRSKARSAVWDVGIRNEVGAFLDKARPFTNIKTHLLYFTSQEGVVKNSEIGCCRTVAFSNAILPLRHEEVLGLNGDILKQVLGFIGNGQVSVTVGESMTHAVVWQGEDRMALLMPLRTLADGKNGITRTELLRDERTGIMPAASLVEPMRKAA